ncbi:MAG: caspase family protein [Pirellulaceae bacterium]
MNHLRLITVCCLALCATSTILSDNRVAADDNRYALVIGNGSYNEERLKNPVNDAKLISKSLADLGFNVETKTDLDQQSMEETISSFSRRLPKNSFAFFFFAGHGIQAKKANYLIPVGAEINSESALKYRTVPLDFVHDELDNSKSNLNVIVLDCCRNNPFERSWKRSMGQTGLAPMPTVPEGTVIAFATADGKMASDGDGNNSPYTTELAAALSTRPQEGLSLVEGVFFKLGRTLKQKAQQHPHLYVDSTMPKYYLWKPSASEEAGSSQPNSDSLSKDMSPSATEPPAQTESPKNEPAKKQTTPEPTETNELLAQAYRYHNEGEFDYAIAAFGALVNDPDVSQATRNLARKGRGGSYIAKGTSKDINLAIIDFKAAKEPGIQMSVMKNEAQMYDGPTVTGKVHRNEIVLLTRSSGDYFWVHSVQGNASRKGWVKNDVIVAATLHSSSVSVSAAKPDAIKTPIQPSNPVVLNSNPIAQPAETSPSNHVPQPQSSPTMISYGPDGKPIGVLPTRNSQAVSISPQQAPGQNSSGQQISFDQYGNPVYQASPSTSPVNRSLVPTPAQQGQTVRLDQFGNPLAAPQSQQRSMTPQNGTVYYDQYGRQINSSNGQQQQVYQTQRYPQQQQQQYTQPTQQPQTYRPQNNQSNNSGFGNNGFSSGGNMSLKDLNAERRDFDRELSRYQWQNGPLTPAERREVNQYRQQNDRAKAKAFWGN